MSRSIGRGKQRITIACSNCRTRRKRCDGEAPCGPCRSLRLEGSCVTRPKARPSRTLHSSTYNALGESSQAGSGTTLARSCEEYVEDLAAGSGHFLDLSLKGIEPVVIQDSPPVIVRDLIVERAAINDMLDEFPHLFSWLSISVIQQAHDLTLDDQQDCPDQRGLAYAAISLGLPGRARWCLHHGTAKDWQGLHYVQLAWAALQAVTTPSITALYAHHCIHHLAIYCSGPQEIRSILEAMAWHITGIQGLEDRNLHRDVLFSTYYKDSWFAALMQMAPLIPTNLIDFASAEIYDTPELNRGAAPDRLWTALVDSERRVIPDQSSDADVATVALRIGLHARRLDNLGGLIAREQKSLSRPFACAFAQIRSSWLRLVLTVPDLSSSSHHAVALPIVARSSARLIQSYYGLYQTNTSFGWCELRRLSTCAWSVARCIWEGELDLQEGQTLLQMVLTMSQARWREWEPGKEFERNLRIVSVLIGLDDLGEANDEAAILGKGRRLSPRASFDYTLPN